MRAPLRLAIIHEERAFGKLRVVDEGGWQAGLQPLLRPARVLNSLERSIEQIEAQPIDTELIGLADVTNALQRIDPIWEVLHPNEQRRVLELLVETITVSKDNVEVRFRANGIEQVVGELEPIGAESND